MANNYNPRSGSSDSPQKKQRPKSSSRANSQRNAQRSGQPRKAATPPTRANSRRSESARNTQPRSSQAPIARVGDVRRANNKNKQQKVAGSLLRRIVTIVIILLVLIAAAVTVYFSPAFSISNLRGEGISYITDTRITKTAAVSANSTLLRLDLNGITERLKTDPWIADVAIERQFPDTLVLNITERTPLAKVEIAPQSAVAKATQWLVSSDNVWLGLIDTLAATGVVIDNEQLKAMPLIKDIQPTVQPADGAVVSDDGIVNAISVLGGFSPQMRALVATISAPNKAGTILGLTNGVGVAFGAAEDISLKETTINTMLQTYAGKLTYINVRVASKPTFRSA
jgi:cell division protein FtsQ